MLIILLINVYKLLINCLLSDRSVITDIRPVVRRGQVILDTDLAAPLSDVIYIRYIYIR